MQLTFFQYPEHWFSINNSFHWAQLSPIHIPASEQMNTVLAWSINETSTNLAHLLCKYYIWSFALIGSNFEQNLVHVYILIKTVLQQKHIIMSYYYYINNKIWEKQEISVLKLYQLHLIINEFKISGIFSDLWVISYVHHCFSLNNSMTNYLIINFWKNFLFHFFLFKMKVAFVQICLILKRFSCLRFFIHNNNNHIFQKYFHKMKNKFELWHFLFYFLNPLSLQHAQ